MRTILHCDINNFYASVECLYNPRLRDVPVAVTGNPEERHGIVLAKNYPAKAFGIKTGDVIWEATAKCPSLVTVRADFKKYLRFSEMIKKIYCRYTDSVEPFGIDEAWLDVSSSERLLGKGKLMADEIRERVFAETGVTASVGVSFNKIFAKLGSDIKKPDATTVIDRHNFKGIVWKLPVSDLLFSGGVTTKKLQRRRIYTIGDLANADIKLLKSWLGKWGQTLHEFANGRDCSPVMKEYQTREIKSVGNSTTCYKDLTSNSEVKSLIYVLAESVACRLKMYNLFAGTVCISIRDSGLQSFTRQGALKAPTQLSQEIALKAMELFIKNFNWRQNIRSIGVKAGNFDTGARQLCFLEQDNYIKNKNMERAVENIRERFGHNAIQRGRVFTDKKLVTLNPLKDNVIHPVGYTV